MEQAITTVGIERPPPDAVRAFIGMHPTEGPPTSTYEYKDSHSTLFFVCDYGDGAAPTRQACWTWNQNDWRSFWPPKPRPLYKLDMLEKDRKAVVQLVEDEHCADAAQRLLKQSLVVTWPGGPTSISLVDWRPLAGRIVNIWPKNHDLGIAAATKIAGYLLQMDCQVGIIDPREQAEDWDLAIAIQEGFQLDDIIDFGTKYKKRVTRVEEKKEEPEAQDPGYDINDDKNVSLSNLWAQMGLSMAKGMPHANLDNAVRILAYHIKTWGAVFYDEFLQKVLIYDDLGQKSNEWSDVDDMRCLLWFQRQIGITSMTLTTVKQAINTIAHLRKRNGLREWLEGIKWDKESRLKNLLPIGFGTKDTVYNQEVGRCFIMGMVARILEPGCKVDNMPVFEGPQGALKGTALEVIGGEYFTEQHEKLGDKDFYMVLSGKMLIEISEMHSFSRIEIDRIKGIVSNKNDRFRDPYAHRATDHLRQCVFAGTTNKYDWNTDDTGARRFWPVRCGKINLRWIQEFRDQLLAEAVYRVSLGEYWHDVPKELAEAEQKKRFASDAFDEQLEYYFSRHASVTMTDCLRDALAIDNPRDWDRTIQNRITSCLRRAGYVSVWRWIDGKSKRIWTRAPLESDIQ